MITEGDHFTWWGEKSVESKPESHLGLAILLAHGNPNDLPNSHIVFNA